VNLYILHIVDRNTLLQSKAIVIACCSCCHVAAKWSYTLHVVDTVTLLQIETTQTAYCAYRHVAKKRVCAHILHIVYTDTLLQSEAIDAAYCRHWHVATKWGYILIVIHSDTLLQSEATHCMLEIQTPCYRVKLHTACWRYRHVAAKCDYMHKKSKLYSSLFHYTFAMYEVKFYKILPAHSGDYKNTVFWVVMPRSLIQIYQQNIEAAHYAESSVHLYTSVGHHIFKQEFHPQYRS
jgi:hypothetical protein